MEYKLTKIKDIFDNVPSDRIKTCMDELSICMQQAKTMSEMLELAIKEVSGKDDVGTIVWPDEFVWIDDGNGTIDIKYADENGSLLFGHHIQVAEEGGK